ncbi:MAG: hypothetical protein ACJ72D_17860 [Marmoricola sp.]
MGTTVPPDVIQFGHLDIAYDSRVGRPDPGSEAQARWARMLLEHGPSGAVLSLYAGVGHVGLLTAAGTGRRLVLVEADEVAREYARFNASSAGMDATEVVGDLDDVGGHEFALVLCGVERDSFGGLGGACACIRAAEERLVPGGALVLALDDVTDVVELVEWLATRDRDLAVQEFLRPDGQGVLAVLRATGRGAHGDGELPADVVCS